MTVKPTGYRSDFVPQVAAQQEAPATPEQVIFLILISERQPCQPPAGRMKRERNRSSTDGHSAVVSSSRSPIGGVLLRPIAASTPLWLSVIAARSHTLERLQRRHWTLNVRSISAETSQPWHRVLPSSSFCTLRCHSTRKSVCAAGAPIRADAHGDGRRGLCVRPPCCSHPPGEMRDRALTVEFGCTPVLLLPSCSSSRHFCHVVVPSWAAPLTRLTCCGAAGSDSEGEGNCEADGELNRLGAQRWHWTSRIST